MIYLVPFLWPLGPVLPDVEVLLHYWSVSWRLLLFPVLLSPRLELAQGPRGRVSRLLAAAAILPTLSLSTKGWLAPVGPLLGPLEQRDPWFPTGSVVVATTPRRKWPLALLRRLGLSLLLRLLPPPIADGLPVGLRVVLPRYRVRFLAL